MNKITKACRIIYSKRYYSKRSPFEVLSLKETASSAEIKQRYKELAMQLHPDKKPTGDLAKFQELVQAYESLANPNMKAYYQKSYSAPPPSPGQRPSSYTNAYWAKPPHSTNYTSNTTFMSLLAGVVVTIAAFNLFYFHTSHTTLLNAADQHHVKSTHDLKKARAEAQLFGNDKGIQRVMENRMKLFRKDNK